MKPADYKNIQRLFIDDATFAPEETRVLSDTQHHYLRNVMRKEVGDSLRVFNGRDGEWISSIKEANKKNTLIKLIKQIHEQKTSPDVWVLVSPVKKEAFEWMIEKASELGASAFFPLDMDHTVVRRVNEERMRLIAIEAAEQCERFDILETHPRRPMADFLSGWDPRRKIIFCQERHDAPAIIPTLQNIATDTPLAILVGPEGGFSDTEMKKLTAMDCIVPVSLGPRILRTETALCAALSCVQAQSGD